MFIVRSSYHGYANPWDAFRIVFFIIIMAVHSDALVKKAVVNWSPNAKPFFDPMIDHAAMVELQLLDRLVFACDESVPAVIYKVSEESFADCKYDTSAEWIGECGRGVRYITLSLRSLGIVSSQTVFVANQTYFFTSFSSGTRHGIRDRRGGLCEMGVRLILEVRDSNARVPLLPRSFQSTLEEIQVPVQRVSYGGRPAKSREDEALDRNGVSESVEADLLTYFDREDDIDSNFLLGWPWFDSSMPRQVAHAKPRMKKRGGGRIENNWEPTVPEFFNYSSAGETVSRWFVVAAVSILLNDG